MAGKENGMAEGLEQTLLTAASEVRRQLEARTEFSSFPSGFCQASARVLGLYLINDLGVKGVEIVCNGERTIDKLDEFGRRRRQSHSWLEVGGFLIDIAGDQFDDCDKPVIVTRDRSWHDLFPGQTRHADWDILDSTDFVKEAYLKVKRRMEE